MLVFKLLTEMINSHTLKTAVFYDVTLYSLVGYRSLHIHNRKNFSYHKLHKRYLHSAHEGTKGQQERK